MVQYNAVSEPSMEEIVNSIRRILENNDQEFTSSNNVQTQVQERQDNVEGKEDVVQEDNSSNNTIFTDHNSRLRKYSSELPQQEKVSLSDIAARVRAEARGKTYESVVDDVYSQGVSVGETSQDKSLNKDIPSSSDLNVPLKESINSSVVSDVSKEEDQMLISSDIGDKVSASFDQLVKALKESGSRSLDQISIDLLRPMLREWLDDNLPGIVERLVREEIERIARGPVRR
ncbi:DUF2497 domain-containing protein [Candidatus Liberibacter brunswickensis]